MSTKPGALPISSRLEGGDLSAAQDLIDHFENEDLSAEGEQYFLRFLETSALPGDVFSKLTEIAWWEALIALSENPVLPSELLQVIAESTRAGIYQNEVQQALVANPRIPEDRLTALLTVPIPPMWSLLSSEEVARRYSVLTSASSDVNALCTLGALAASRGEQKEATRLWEELFGAAPDGATVDRLRDADPGEPSIDDLTANQQELFALHPLTSDVTLFFLSHLEEEVVDRALADNPSTPPFLVAYYASLEGEVETLAWQNPVLPSYTWQWIDRKISPSSEHGDWDKAVLLTAAANHGIPLATLNVLATSGHADVRATIAGNICTPVDVLRALAGDSDASVRREVLQNLSATDEVRAIAT
jgi:hypothetical protein